jgi:hypothetical protein
MFFNKDSFQVIGSPIVIEGEPETRIAKAECPVIMVVCMVYCPFGNAVDANGCMLPCMLN